MVDVLNKLIPQNSNTTIALKYISLLHLNILIVQEHLAKTLYGLSNLGKLPKCLQH